MALTAEEKRQRRAAASASDRRAEADRSKRRRKNEDEVARQQDRKRRQRRRVEIMEDAEADDDYANMVLDNAAARAHACRQRLRRCLKPSVEAEEPQPPLGIFPTLCWEKPY